MQALMAALTLGSTEVAPPVPAPPVLGRPPVAEIPPPVFALPPVAEIPPPVFVLPPVAALCPPAPCAPPVVDSLPPVDVGVVTGVPPLALVPPLPKGIALVPPVERVLVVAIAPPVPMDPPLAGDIALVPPVVPADAPPDALCTPPVATALVLPELLSDEHPTSVPTSAQGAMITRACFLIIAAS